MLPNETMIKSLTFNLDTTAITPASINRSTVEIARRPFGAWERGWLTLQPSPSPRFRNISIKNGNEAPSCAKTRNQNGGGFDRAIFDQEMQSEL